MPSWPQGQFRPSLGRIARWAETAALPRDAAMMAKARRLHSAGDTGTGKSIVAVGDMTSGQDLTR